MVVGFQDNTWSEHGRPHSNAQCLIVFNRENDGLLWVIMGYYGLLWVIMGYYDDWSMELGLPCVT